MGMRLLLYLALICVLLYAMQFIQDDTVMYKIALVFAVLIAGFALYEVFNIIEDWMEDKTVKKRVYIMLLYLVFIYILIYITPKIENKFGIANVVGEWIVRIAGAIGVIVCWEVIEGLLNR